MSHWGESPHPDETAMAAVPFVIPTRIQVSPFHASTPMPRSKHHTRSCTRRAAITRGAAPDALPLQQRYSSVSNGAAAAAAGSTPALPCYLARHLPRGQPRQPPASSVSGQSPQHQFAFASSFHLLYSPGLQPFGRKTRRVPQPRTLARTRDWDWAS
jgi:hypothetical protein